MRISELKNAAVVMVAVLVSSLPAVAGAKDRLWIDGDSSLHPWTTEATRFDVRYVFTEAPADAAALEQQVRDSQLKSLEMVVKVVDLKSKEEKLDENLRAALKSDAHPTIVFKVSSYQVLPASRPGSEFDVRAKGTLEVAGAQRPIELLAHAFRTPEGIRFRSTVPIRMTDYGVKPPELFLGTIKTRNDVRVHFDVQLKVPAPRLQHDASM